MSKTTKNIAVKVQRGLQSQIESAAKQNNNNHTNRRPTEGSQVSGKSDKPRKRGVLKKKLIERMEVLKEETISQAAIGPKEQLTTSLVNKTSSRKEQNALMIKNAVAVNTGTLETRNKTKNTVATKRVLQPIQEDGQPTSSPVKVKAKAKAKTANAVNGSAKKVKRVLKKKAKVDTKE